MIWWLGVLPETQPKLPLFSLKYAKCSRAMGAKEAYSDAKKNQKTEHVLLLPMLVVNVNPIKVN